MQPPNFQKLIVVFLSIAIISSSLMLGINGYLNRKHDPQAQVRSSGQGGPFVENLSAGNQDPEIAALEARLKENATEKVAGLLAEQILTKNPGGPVQGVNGLEITIPGGLEKFVSDYIATQSSFSPEVLKIQIEDEDIKTIQSTSTEVLARYLSRTSQLISEATSLNSMNNGVGGAAEDQVREKLSNLQTSLKILREMEVPIIFLDFHKNLLASLELSTSYTYLVEIDPMGAAILGDTYSKELSKYTDRLSKETEELNKLSFLPKEERTLLQKMLGIQTAHAIIPVTDWASLVQAIKEFFYQYKKDIMEILTEMLKNRLLREMTRQVVVWATGGGKPQFVTNWNTFLEGAANEAAGAVIQEIAPQLCGSAQDIGNIVGLGKVSDFIRKIMQPIDITSRGAGFPGCTLDRVITNIEDFQNDLRNGGWLAYTSTLEPQNNFFGNIITIAEKQLEAAERAKDEALNKALAGNGYVGQEVCDDGNAPKEGGGCANGEKPHVVTPGTNTASLTSKSFDAAYDRLINAKDYKALAAYVADAALTRLVQKGVRGLLAAVGGRNSGGGGGGGDDDNTAPPKEEPSSNVKELAEQILVRKQSSLNDARMADETLGETIGILQQTASLCTANPTIAADAAAQIQMLAPLRDSMSLKIQSLRPQVEGLQTLVKNMPASYTIDQLTTAYGTLAAAQTEAEKMSTDRINIEGVYSSAASLFASCSSDIINGGGGIPPEPTSTATSTEGF